MGLLAKGATIMTLIGKLAWRPFPAQHFPAIIKRVILDSNGALAIPRGSDAELVIRQTEGGSMRTASELVLDVESVTDHA